MKRITRNLLLLSTVLLLTIPETANALSGFSRQTGKSCSACHTQNMPKLNAYGRHFALSGYTLYDAENETQSLLEGSDITLGLPAVLNVSAVLKARYTKVDQTRGEVNVLEGSGLYFGGRVADNAGALISLTGDPSEDRDVVFGGKALLAYETLNGFSGLSLYSTQTNGIFSGMENYNTGLYSPLKQFENANATNAAQATALGRGPATGLQAYYGDDHLLVTIGATIPSQNSEGIDAGSSLIPFGRIAYNQPIGEWNLMIGAYGFSGTVKASDQSLDGGVIDSHANLVDVKKEGYGFDLEASGSIAEMMTMTTINIVLKNTVNTDANLSSANLQKTDNRAASVEFQINPVAPLGLKIAYLTYNSNDTVGGAFIRNFDYNTPSVGVSYLFRQNFNIDLQYSHNYPTASDIDDFYELYLSAVIAF
ncbi:MAG: hypothetical protein ABFR02_06385 [Campylobacterota bacterium]